MTTPTPPRGFAEAIDQFNSWRFYDAHETLEDIWRETGPKGDDATLANFYQGIIKAAAGYHHLLRGNYNGVIKVLGDAPQLLAPYTPRTMGVDVAALIAAIRDTIARVEDLGPDHLAAFERTRIPTIEWEKPEQPKRGKRELVFLLKGDESDEELEEAARLLIERTKQAQRKPK